MRDGLLNTLIWLEENMPEYTKSGKEIDRESIKARSYNEAYMELKRIKNKLLKVKEINNEKRSVQ